MGRRVRAKNQSSAITRKQSKELLCSTVDEFVEKHGHGPVDKAIDDACDAQALEIVNGSETIEANGACVPIGANNKGQDAKTSARASDRNDEDARDLFRSVSPISSISELGKHQDSDDGDVSPMAGPGPRTFLTKRSSSAVEVASMVDVCPSPSHRQTAVPIKDEDPPQSAFVDPCSVGITSVRNDIESNECEAG